MDFSSFHWFVSELFKDNWRMHSFALHKVRVRFDIKVDGAFDIIMCYLNAYRSSSTDWVVYNL